MLSQALKRSFATIPNRRVFPTTTTSPTPSTHNDKHIDVKPPHLPSPDLNPDIHPDQSTSHAISEHLTPKAESAEQSSNWSIPQSVQDSFPKPGAKRPHLNIKVSPNHGLWHFFRALRFENTPLANGQAFARRIDDMAESDNASWRRVAQEAVDPLRSISGRSWSAAELRRKSFMDLHTLWYIVLRERNLLATQAKEMKRALLPPASFDLVNERTTKCRKTHARIKLVLSERRRGYERAIESLPNGLSKWRKERWGSNSVPEQPEPKQPEPEALSQTQ